MLARLAQSMLLALARADGVAQGVQLLGRSGFAHELLILLDALFHGFGNFVALLALVKLEIVGAVGGKGQFPRRRRPEGTWANPQPWPAARTETPLRLTHAPSPCSAAHSDLAEWKNQWAWLLSPETSLTGMMTECYAKNVPECRTGRFQDSMPPACTASPRPLWPSESWRHRPLSLFRVKGVAFHTIRPAVSRKHRGFFRSVLAGRRCAAASRFVFFSMIKRSCGRFRPDLPHRRPQGAGRRTRCRMPDMPAG